MIIREKQQETHAEKAIIPVGTRGFSTQLGELSAENTGLGESLPKTMAAAFLCDFHFSD